MAVTKEEIRSWLTGERAKGATHMIVATDTFDHSDYPVYVMSDEKPSEKVSELMKKDMTSVMECYDLSMDIEKQLAEVRSFHLETTELPARPIEKDINDIIFWGIDINAEVRPLVMKTSDEMYKVPCDSKRAYELGVRNAFDMLDQMLKPAEPDDIFFICNHGNSESIPFSIDDLVERLNNKG